MNDDYQIGDLIEATIIEKGAPVRIQAVYIPNDPDDYLPFRRLVPNAAPVGQWFGLHELGDVLRLVAVPRSGGQR